MQLITVESGLSLLLLHLFVEYSWKSQVQLLLNLIPYLLRLEKERYSVFTTAFTSGRHCRPRGRKHASLMPSTVIAYMFRLLFFFIPLQDCVHLRTSSSRVRGGFASFGKYSHELKCVLEDFIGEHAQRLLQSKAHACLRCVLFIFCSFVLL